MIALNVGGGFSESCPIAGLIRGKIALLFTPVSITTLIGTEDARFILNGISPIAKGDLKWRDALLVTGTVNSNKIADSIQKDKIDK